MKKLAFAAILAAPTFVLAQQGILGSKSSPVTPPAGSAGPAIGIWELAQTGLALALVAALLKWGLPWLLKKFTPGAASEGEIRIKESATLGASQLHLVEVGGRTLLVGSTAQNVSLLSDLSEAPAPQASSPSPAPAASPLDDRVFFEELDDAMESEAEPFSLRAVISSPKAEQPAPEPRPGMSMEEAVALISSAKKRAGMENPTTRPEAKPQARTEAKPQARTAAKAQPKRGKTSPSDDDILAALDRIAKLTS